MIILQDFNFDIIELDYPIHCSRHIKVTYMFLSYNTKIDISGFPLLSAYLINHSIAMIEETTSIKIFGTSNVSSTITIKCSVGKL